MSTSTTPSDEPIFTDAHHHDQSVPVDPYETSLEMPWRRYMEVVTLRALAGDITGNVVVDLGCGAGAFTRRMREWGASLAIGADVSPEMIARARQIEQQEGRGGIDYLVADLTGPCDCAAQGYGHLVGKVDLAMAAYLLSYATTPEDLTAMCRHASTDLRPGGRLLAAVLSPDFCQEPGWYDPYGFSVTPHREPLVESEPVRLTAPPGPPTADTVVVDPVWWSVERYEAALREVGFATITWHPFVLGQEGIDRFGERFWENYLARPHVCVIEATMPIGQVR